MKQLPDSLKINKRIKERKYEEIMEEERNDEEYPTVSK
jgi:hypothetical protein